MKKKKVKLVVIHGKDVPATNKGIVFPDTGLYRAQYFRPIKSDLVIGETKVSPEKGDTIINFGMASSESFSAEFYDNDFGKSYWSGLNYFPTNDKEYFEIVALYNLLSKLKTEIVSVEILKHYHDIYLYGLPTSRPEPNPHLVSWWLNPDNPPAGKILERKK